MKLKLGFILILCQILAGSALAQQQQIRAQKSTFVPKEAGAYHASQQVAVNTRTGATLVVWQKATSSGYQILGRMVNRLGNPASSTFSLVAGPLAAHPAVTYNPVRNEFILAYDDNPNVDLKRTNVYTMRLNAQGRPGGTPIILTTDDVSKDMANFFPKIVFNAKTGGYVVLWLREIVNAGQSDKGNNGLVGALMTTGGALGGPTVMIQKTILEGNRLWGPIPMDVLQHPGNQKLVVVFVQIVSGTNAGQANYWLVTMDASLGGRQISKINNAPLSLSSKFAWGARLALFPTTPGFVFFADTGNVKRRRIDLQGKLSGAQIVAFKPPRNNTRLVYPAVAFVTNAKGTYGILVATQDAFSETGAAATWAQVLNSNGIPVGAPIRVDLTSATDTALSGILTPLPAKPTDTLFRFMWFNTLAQFKAPGQTFELSGLVKVNLTLTIP